MAIVFRRWLGSRPLWSFVRHSSSLGGPLLLLWAFGYVKEAADEVPFLWAGLCIGAALEVAAFGRCAWLVLREQRDEARTELKIATASKAHLEHERDAHKDRAQFLERLYSEGALMSRAAVEASDAVREPTQQEALQEAGVRLLDAADALCEDVRTRYPVGNVSWAINRAKEVGREWLAPPAFRRWLEILQVHEYLHPDVPRNGVLVTVEGEEKDEVVPTDIRRRVNAFIDGLDVSDILSLVARQNLRSNPGGRPAAPQPPTF